MGSSPLFACTTLLGLFSRCLACETANMQLTQLLKEIMDANILDAATNATVGHLPRALGDCAKGSDAALQPCQHVEAFPFKGDGFNFDYSVNYLMHVDTLRVKNISAHCSTTPPQGQEAWIADFDLGFDRLSLGTTVTVHFPHLVVEAPCLDKTRCFVNLDDVAFRVAARVRCVGKETLGIEVAPDVGVQFSKPLEFDMYGHKVDFTQHLSNGVGSVVEQVHVPCPAAGPGLLCRALCSLPGDARVPNLEEAIAAVPPSTLEKVAAVVPAATVEQVAAVVPKEAVEQVVAGVPTDTVEQVAAIVPKETVEQVAAVVPKEAVEQIAEVVPQLEMFF